MIGVNVQTVEQVFAETAARTSSSSRRLVAATRDVDVDVDRTAHALEGLLFEEAQQLRLETGHHLANFVEEDSAAVGGFWGGRGFCRSAPVKAPRS